MEWNCQAGGGGGGGGGDGGDGGVDRGMCHGPETLLLRMSTTNFLSFAWHFLTPLLAS